MSSSYSFGPSFNFCLHILVFKSKHEKKKNKKEKAKTKEKKLTMKTKSEIRKQGNLFHVFFSFSSFDLYNVCGIIKASFANVAEQWELVVKKSMNWMKKESKKVDSKLDAFDWPALCSTLANL